MYTGHPLVDASVLRVASTVSTTRGASSNMGQNSPHEDSSPGQGHSLEDTIQIWEIQTLEILETVTQVTSRKAMSGHVYVRARVP